MFCFCSGHCKNRVWRTVGNPLSETDHLEPAQVWPSLLYRYTNSFLRSDYFCCSFGVSRGYTLHILIIPATVGQFSCCSLAETVTDKCGLIDLLVNSLFTVCSLSGARDREPTGCRKEGGRSQSEIFLQYGWVPQDKAWEGGQGVRLYVRRMKPYIDSHGRIHTSTANLYSVTHPLRLTCVGMVTLWGQHEDMWLKIFLCRRGHLNMFWCTFWFLFIFLSFFLCVQRNCFVYKSQRTW